MRVKRLKLTNFRGISDLTLEFPDEGATVFIGTNGAGKSSILDCLAMTISEIVDVLQIRNTNTEMVATLESGYHDLSEEATEMLQERKRFQSSDIKQDCQFAEIELVLQSHGQSESPPVKPVNYVIKRVPFGVIGQSIESVKALDPLFIRPIRQPKFHHILQVVVYYTTNRAVSDVALTDLEDDRTAFSQLTLHELALTSPQINFQAFFTWFKQREDLENERRLHEDPAHRDPQLQAVRRAIASLLPEFSNLRVRRSPLRLTIDKTIGDQTQELVINQLSDGEKCLLAMVGDLALRLAICSDALYDPLQGGGIVLIDEIELHLHPSWQRMIIPALTRTFPNCQFIVTTHSPQVLGEVKGQVYKLKATSDGIVAEPHQTFGKDSNRILEEDMGASERSPEIQDHLRQLFRSIEDGDLAGARQLQQALEAEIADSGYEGELANADVLIRRRELLGR